MYLVYFQGKHSIAVPYIWFQRRVHFFIFQFLSHSTPKSLFDYTIQNVYTRVNWQKKPNEARPSSTKTDFESFKIFRKLQIIRDCSVVSRVIFTRHSFHLEIQQCRPSGHTQSNYCNIFAFAWCILTLSRDYLYRTIHVSKDRPRLVTSYAMLM